MTFRIYGVFFAILGLFSPAVFGDGGTALEDMPAGNYQVDPTHASLTWQVSHLGLSNYTARFTTFDAAIQLNSKQMAKSSVTATIDTSSLETDYPYPEEKDFDKKLIEQSDWFNAGKFPKITFKSTGIETVGDKQMVMKGTLTMLGVSQLVSLDVTLNGAMLKQPFSKKPTLGFSAKGSLTRSEFGMATYVPNIGDEVTFMIEAEFAKND